MVSENSQLCCLGYFCPAPLEVDCCESHQSPEDPVLDLVLDLHLLELVLDSADP